MWLAYRSHMQLRHADYSQQFTWAFHGSVEIGPAMLARIAKKTGLCPEDLDSARLGTGRRSLQ